MNENKITLLAVEYDKDKDMYGVKIPAGSNVSETAFCITVVVKCLMRDGVIKKSEEITDLINKFCNDPQYDEVNKGENNK